MTDMPANPPAPSTLQISSKEVVEWAQAIGQALNTTVLYGATHKVAQSSMDRGYPAVSALIEQYGGLHVSIAEGDLLVNGTSSQGAPLAGSLITRLVARNLLSFVMEAGLSMDEYRAFFALLIAPPSSSKTSPEAATLGIQHITAQNVTYRRVVEGEAAPAAPEAPTGPPVTTAPEPAAATSPSSADLANVVAFLKGDSRAVEEQVRQDVRHIAEDPEKLAELILRSATVREQASDLETGESLTSLVVGCINRLTGTLAESPASKTQKGRKQAKHTLLLLEEKLLAHLHSLAGTAADREAVEAAFAEAVEDLDVESLTVKYVKSRRAAEKAEARMRKLVKRVGDDPAQENELRDRLLDQGLSPEDWAELSVSQESSAAPALSPGSGLKEIKTLTLLLARLGETLTQPKTPTSEPAEADLQNLITETGKQMQKLVAGTEKKIDSFRTLASTAPSGKTQGKPESLSRKALLEMLAEIAQELSQPLTIINATLDMLRGQRSGPITAAQGELLALATDSGAQLGHLVACLMKVAGTPESLHPDHDMLREAYRAGGAPSDT